MDEPRKMFEDAEPVDPVAEAAKAVQRAAERWEDVAKVAERTLYRADEATAKSVSALAMAVKGVGPEVAKAFNAALRSGDSGRGRH